MRSPTNQAPSGAVRSSFTKVLASLIKAIRCLPILEMAVAGDETLLFVASDHLR